MNPNRRTFLKSASAGLITTALSPQPAFAKSPATEPEEGLPSSLIDQVNILQGTNSIGIFSRGNTLPIAALPFGMAHWTLHNTDREPWFFHPDDRRVLGIRCTHQLSPWLATMGKPRSFRSRAR